MGWQTVLESKYIFRKKTYSFWNGSEDNLESETQTVASFRRHRMVKDLSINQLQGKREEGRQMRTMQKDDVLDAKKAKWSFNILSKRLKRSIAKKYIYIIYIKFPSDKHSYLNFAPSKSNNTNYILATLTKADSWYPNPNNTQAQGNRDWTYYIICLGRCMVMSVICMLVPLCYYQFH